MIVSWQVTWRILYTGSVLNTLYFQYLREKNHVRANEETILSSAIILAKGQRQIHDFRKRGVVRVTVNY